MVIRQGDVFWGCLSPNVASEPAYRRPMLVVQRDSINRSNFNTVLVVPLTKQTKHAVLPGNVLVHKGEANLPKPSLARGTHVMVVDKSRLMEKIGTLSQERTRDIINKIIWALGGVRNSQFNL